MSNTNAYPIVERSDTEIDLAALLVALWKRRLVVIAITALSVLVAAVYVTLATPVYQTNTLLGRVSDYELSRLNYPDVYEIDGQTALGRAASVIGSFDKRYEFYLDNKELYALEEKENLSEKQEYTDFDDENVFVVMPDPEAFRDNYAQLRLDYSPPTKGVEIVNRFVAWAQEQELARIGNEIRRAVDTKLRESREQIAGYSAQFRASTTAEIQKLLEDDAIRRQELNSEKEAITAELALRKANRLKQLEEAISTAKSLGFVKPELSAMPSWQAPATGRNVVRSDEAGDNTPRSITTRSGVGGATQPLYFLGTEALTSERDLLLARKDSTFAEPRLVEIETELALLNSNPRAEALRARSEGDGAVLLEEVAELEGTIARLEAIEVDLSGVKLVTSFREAVDPIKPIWPKKALILIAACFLGGLLGLLVAFLMNAVESAKLSGRLSELSQTNASESSQA